MRTRTAASLTALAALLLAGCSSDPDPAPSPSIGISDLGIEADAGIPPAPTGTSRAQYLAAARAIDPAITEDVWSDSSLIFAGRDACQAIHQEVSEEQQAQSMANRLSYSGWTATGDDAKSLIAAARMHICPDY